VPRPKCNGSIRGVYLLQPWSIAQKDIEISLAITLALTLLHSKVMARMITISYKRMVCPSRAQSPSLFAQQPSSQINNGATHGDFVPSLYSCTGSKCTRGTLGSA
jgi:hypothetical protein